jgi:hypothetical protein
MENVFEINKNFNFSEILLDNPSPLTGGSYFTKLLVNNGTKKMYLQLPKVTSKQGIIRNKDKTYCDLMFTSANKELIYWFEQLEKRCQELIFNKKDLWFHNTISKDDIEEMMNPIIRSYKSGKFFLVRVYIKNNKCTAFDEDKKVIDIDKLSVDDEIIPIINLEGIKFSSRTIQLEINLTQYMQLIPSQEFEKQFLIKLDKEKANIGNLEETKIYNKDIIDKKLESDNLDEIKESIDNDSNSLILDIEDNEIVAKSKNIDNQLESKDKIDLNENLVKDTDSDILNQNNDLKEISLDLIPSRDNNDVVSLKDPLEVYKEIYLVARKKAFELRKNALEAYLEAENIKNKYSLENMEESDDENDFVELFKNNL